MKKDKTISFRVNVEKFDRLQSIADDQELSLSSVFREYVDEIILHDGQVEVVPDRDVRKEAGGGSSEFPPTVEVPKSFVREHERLELECHHLEEQLAEHRQYATTLEWRLETHAEQEEEMIRLEEVDFEVGTSLLIE